MIPSVRKLIGTSFLSRDDIVNRSIPGDGTKHFLHRLEDVYSLNPKVCIIMGGINDILHNAKLYDIINNFKELTGNIKEHDIIPIIQSTLYVSSQISHYRNINAMVKELNLYLYKHAQNEDIRYIDINAVLTYKEVLNDKYTYNGINISGDGLIMWRNRLRPILLEY